ncbi:efflux RND transporter periplasmic adaptor subunit [Chitinophaga pinensis]|uniref:Efflux transporter, RND family, MFP subunit n=1 Tax=Chitinophaga pinensis (strain ATCC 43595 / DSM 2588 / LMG 13176 / NBRC 15968 / NCIMB 11800 / UQM 2034) TaxID=485918 RepID=A0A979G7P2_CHIPD|nr:efflux RND transporter periplasmic adaptor subunit [Chitinophaga pinensis]ACU62236.1 efflux transporter, RND family, MFP subunit [Chitinophaga pinensis DSM 2588]
MTNHMKAGRQASPGTGGALCLTGMYIIPAALSLLLLGACGQTESGYANNGPQEFPIYTIQQAPTTLKVQYPASLEGQQNIEIRPKIDGYIREILVDEGAVVKKGQLLFVIDAPQYEQEVRTATAAIQSAEAEVSAAKLQVSNLTPLVKKEIITATALEAAQYNLEAKEAVLSQARAGLANAHTNIGYTRIVSPVDGIVGAIPNKIGSLVSPSAPQALTMVSNIRNIYAYFSFDEKEFLAFTAKYKGQSVHEKLQQMPPVSLVLPDGTHYPEQGRVETVNGMIDRSTGAISFRATFPNPAGIIRSGGSATLEIPMNLSSALLLPQQATFEMQGMKMVYVVSADGMVKSREVHVMDIGTSDSYVVESGLQAGDKVVAEGMGNLKDSLLIKPVPAKPLAQQ